MNNAVQIKNSNVIIQNKNKRVAEKLTLYGMLSPTFVMSALFILYPIIYLIYYSFMEYDGHHPAKWIGFYNYVRAFKDKSWWDSVLNTFQLGIAVPAIQIPLSLFLAVILNSKIKGRNTLRAVFFLPNITSSAVMGVIFYFMFSTQGGIINEYLKAAGLIMRPIDWFASGFLAKSVIVIFRIWAGTGFYMIMFLAALQRIPHEVYESAAIDGARGIRVFFSITLPMLGRMFQIISALQIIDAMKLYDSVRALTNGAPAGKTQVMTMYIFTYFFEGGGGGSMFAQQGYASAVSVLATIIISIVSLIYLFITRKTGDEDE